MEQPVHKKLIEMEQVSFAYDGEEAPVWQGLNCYFEEGTVNLLLGPSGCGKSTLLYMLNGIVPNFYEGTAEGHIWFKGEDILEKKTKDMVQYVGMVFQNPETQFCTFTVEDELAFGLENENAPRDEIDSRIDEALDMVGMGTFRKSLLTSLSGGQKQKIAIASVLVMQSEILILDEPTANLDAVSRTEVFSLLKQLVDRYGKTIILVEHNLEQLLDKTGHVIVLDGRNKVCLEGSASHVLRNLVYNPEFRNLNIFLPEKYLIVKEWIYALDCVPQVVDFRERQLADRGEAIIPIEEFAGLLRKLAVFSSVNTCSGAAHRSVDKVVEACGLGYAYPGREDAVLKRIDIRIERKDFVAVVGANGAGKSTFLKVLFRVLSPYQGSLRVGGNELDSYDKKLLYRDFGLVFQNPEDQFVTNKVYDELMFSLKKSGMSEAEKEKQVNGMLERFHLDSEREKSPFLLSQGQKRRLSVAAMLLTGQKVLILDEPTYGQDYDNQRELMELMRELNREGVTIIVVTHDMTLVADYADKVIVLVDGKTEFCGLPEDIFDNMEAVNAGKLQLPSSWSFSRELRSYVGEVPFFFSRGRMTDYLIRCVKEV
ncbi:putative ABC transporter ATP-binding protein [Lachnospiraceae bacterium]|nr:putative ABC transporter ATP-binding protein [Lachnospiraceae bacterium]BDF37245.1 putative ABC transporter ATP-binding protein [Lachnospiraceae bacterium]